MAAQCLRMTYKTLCFDKSKYKSIEEINQDTPTSSASQLKNQV